VREGDSERGSCIGGKMGASYSSPHGNCRPLEEDLRGEVERG